MFSQDIFQIAIACHTKRWEDSFETNGDIWTCGPLMPATVVQTKLCRYNWCYGVPFLSLFFRGYLRRLSVHTMVSVITGQLIIIHHHHWVMNMLSTLRTDIENWHVVGLLKKTCICSCEGRVRSQSITHKPFDISSWNFSYTSGKCWSGLFRYFNRIFQANNFD